MNKREAEKKINAFKETILPILCSFFDKNTKKRNFYNHGYHYVSHSFIDGTKNSEFNLQYHFSIRYKNSETVVKWCIPLGFKNFDDISKFKKLSKEQKDIFLKELDKIESSELEMTKEYCSHIWNKFCEEIRKDVSSEFNINGIKYNLYISYGEISITKDYYPHYGEHRFNNYTIVSVGDNIFDNAINEIVEKGSIKDSVEEVKRIIEFVVKNINTEIDSSIDLNKHLSLFLKMNLRLT